MSVFRFKKFAIQQEPAVMKFGTDSMLLGSLMELETASGILDIGTGTGILSLMAAQRSRAVITAIDKDPAAVKLAKSNVAASPWAARIEVLEADLLTFASDLRFDVIISNPPYFADNGQYDKSFRKSTRSRDGLSFPELVKGVLRNLSNEGSFWLVLPEAESRDFEKIAARSQLRCYRKINIRSYASEPIIRRVLAFSRSANGYSEMDLVIYRDFQRYSDQYIQLTKDFHSGEGSYFARD